MKTIMALGAGLVALGTGYHLDGVPTQHAPHSAAMGTLSAPQSYRLHVPGKAVACEVTKGRRLSAGVAEIALSPGCADAYAGLEHATRWREETGGDVVLAAADGRALVRFAVGDGVAYESYRPRQPFMSLSLTRYSAAAAE